MNKDNELKKLHSLQLKIALEIKRICEKYDIKYFLDAGSMLGAVRHQGFIPWDDDMDFGMLREDYERFINIAKTELRSEFFLDNYYTNEENALVFTKIRLRDTIFIEKKGNPNMSHNEIFVDVFPYYYVSDNVIQRRIEGGCMKIFSHAILSKSGYKVWKGEKFTKRLKFIPTDIMGSLLTKKQLHKIVDFLYNIHSNTKKICVHDGVSYDYWYFDADILDDMVSMDFEGICFLVPQRYDEYLSIGYGDYMNIPPEDKRKTHQAEIIDFGKY